MTNNSATPPAAGGPGFAPRIRDAEGRYRSHPEPDWSAIRAEYENTEIAIEDICARHKIAQSTLYDRRRQGGWQMRVGSSVSERSFIIARMFRVLESQVHELEEDMKKTDRPSGPGPRGEKEARVLTSLARTLDKLIEIDDTERRAKARSSRSSRELDELRHELARRIVKLTQR